MYTYEYRDTYLCIYMAGCRWHLLLKASLSPLGRVGGNIQCWGRVAPVWPHFHRLGLTRLGLARLGLAWPGPGTARLGSAFLGPARLGSAWLGSARLGSVRPGLGAISGMGEIFPPPRVLRVGVAPVDFPARSMLPVPSLLVICLRGWGLAVPGPPIRPKPCGFRVGGNIRCWGRVGPRVAPRPTARPESSRLGPTWPGPSRPRDGSARLGHARPGTVRLLLAQLGASRLGLARP